MIPPDCILLWWVFINARFCGGGRTQAHVTPYENGEQMKHRAESEQYNARRQIEIPAAASTDPESSVTPTRQNKVYCDILRTVIFAYVCLFLIFCLTLGFIRVLFLLCLCLCRGTTAHAHINKALLWRRLSERTPAAAVAVWTEKLLWLSKTHTKSLSGVRLTVYSLWFSGKPYDRPNNGMLISTGEYDDWKLRSEIKRLENISDILLHNKSFSTATYFFFFPLTRLNWPAPAETYSSSPHLLSFLTVAQLLSVCFCTSVLCCRL